MGVLEQIAEFAENCDLRRNDLMSGAHDKAKKRKALTVFAGILALSSAAAITALINNYFGGTGLLIAASISAGSSGVISIFVSTFYDAAASQNMLVGSTQYLRLRDSATELLHEPQATDSHRRDALSRLRAVPNAGCLLRTVFFNF